MADLYRAPILVLVDMQPIYNASHRVLDQVEQELSLALSEQWHIVALMWQGKGPIYGRLLKMMQRSSTRFVLRRKNNKDGSPEVLHALQSKGWQAERFRIVGVNTHQCVQATTIGLADKLPQIPVEVLTNACAGPTANDWSKFPERENLTLASRISHPLQLSILRAAAHSTAA